MLRFLGLGMLRRWVTIGLCAGAFWAGAEVQHLRLVDRCLEAGGTIDTRGLCRGLR
ncbi:MAG: hypothetical protein AAFQ79_16950 [Pseudomonadota bacterium]